MDLQTIWFLAIAVLWTGYFVLEGFDFGVGMLLPVIGRDDTDRRVMINSIGPVWDGNEVWLITAIGATFAAFPAWYGSMLSGFYLPFLAIVLALIVRGVAFEYRGKVDDDRWRRRWDVAIVVGSTVPALAWGLIFADLLRGLPMGPNHVVDAGLADMLNPYALLGALVTGSLFLLHGAVFLSLKTDGPVRVLARAVALRAAIVAVPALVGFLGWTLAHRPAGWTLPVAVVAVVALVTGAGLAGRGREGWGFASTAASVLGASAVIFGSMFPVLDPSAPDPALSLTVPAAAPGPDELAATSWVARGPPHSAISHHACSAGALPPRVPRAHTAPAH